MLRKLQTNKGFSLLEVMVTVFVLAIGLLGLAGLQLTGLSNNHSAYLRSQATQFTYNMADQMRTNPVGLTAGAYNSPTAASTPACLTIAGCTPAQMAKQDMFDWATSISNALPGGAATICLDASPEDGTSAATACSGAGNIYAVKIWWTDDRSGSEKRFVTTVRF